MNDGKEGFEANLGYGVTSAFNLDYGTDVLAPGFQDGDAPALKNQTILGYRLPNPLYMFVT